MSIKKTIFLSEILAGVLGGCVFIACNYPKNVSDSLSLSNYKSIATDFSLGFLSGIAGGIVFLFCLYLSACIFYRFKNDISDANNIQKVEQENELEEGVNEQSFSPKGVALFIDNSPSMLEDCDFKFFYKITLTMQPSDPSNTSELMLKNNSRKDFTGIDLLQTSKKVVDHLFSSNYTQKSITFVLGKLIDEVAFYLGKDKLEILLENFIKPYDEDIYNKLNESKAYYLQELNKSLLLIDGFFHRTEKEINEKNKNSNARIIPDIAKEITKVCLGKSNFAFK